MHETVPLSPRAGGSSSSAAVGGDDGGSGSGSSVLSFVLSLSTMFPSSSSFVDRAAEMTLSDILWHMLAFSAVCCAVFFVCSHFTFQKARGVLKGPSWVPPIIGNIVSMVRDPRTFWERQRLYNPNGLSVNYVAGQFVVFCTNTKLCRIAFCRVQKYVLYAHPIADRLLGKDNFIYMNAADHKKFRALLLPSFYGKPQLQMYLSDQEKCVRQHLRQTADSTDFINVRQPLRILAAHASQGTLLGPYLTTEQQSILAAEYRWMTEAFISFPIPFPGNGLWKGMQARKKILEILVDVSKQSKQHMLNGGEPKCGTDYWVKEMMDKRDPDRMETDYKMGNAILDFLFASQDATTSSLVWTMCLLHAHPEVCEKVRSEVTDHCGSSCCSISSKYESLEYTQKVALECLRHRPPVPMVPYKAKSDQQLTKDYLLPKGAMIIPSITGAAQADGLIREFDPSKVDDRDFNQTMVFGAGPHKCLGRKIAIQFIAIFIAVICTEFEIDRKLSEKCDEIRYLPTLYPKTNIFSINRRPKEMN